MGCFGSRIAFLRSCSFPAGRRNSHLQNIFTVQNVDDTGQGVSPGKLEVTETDLVLHVKGKPSLTWPLRCLRRYGYDNDLFSFESGRRCPTGAGIFAFRCHRAQSLFNLLQSKIQGNSSSSLPLHPSTPITPPIVGTPVNTGNIPTTVSTPVSSTFVYVNLSESNSSRFITSSTTAVAATPVNSSSAGQATSSEPPDVVQTQSGSSSITAATQTQEQMISHSVGRGPVKPYPDQNHPVYMNVESHGGALFSASGPIHNYQNNLSSIPLPARRPGHGSSELRPTTSSSVVAGPSSSIRPSSSSGCQSHDALYTNVFCYKGASSSRPFGAPCGVPIQEPAEINYAELDLKTDRPSSSSNSPFNSKGGLLRHQLLSSSQSAPQPSVDPQLNKLRLAGGAGTTDIHPKVTNDQNNGELGYATIDFDKTAALSVITRSKITLGFTTSDNETSSSSKKSRHGSAAL
ncbi:Fibroblast growth factor receptor substrate 2 [Orchesella cincta]|uniref:Fibroblast growth factor receptor substrate 2 n=1 Tax=Orchesella cincta TaxID=48709 RepID=A0A1D2N4C8_ORCCI|nr:Fibroblast growth factor receptor substrate 2 [Orchesella cincta]